MGVEWSSGPGWRRRELYRGRQDTTTAELHLLKWVLVGAVIGAAAMTVVLVLLGMRG